MQILCCCYNKCLLLPLGVAVFQYLYLYFLEEQPRGVCALSNLSSKFVWFPFKANCIAHPGPACLLVVSTMSHDGQLMSDSYYAEFLLSHLKECCRTSFFFYLWLFQGHHVAMDFCQRQHAVHRVYRVNS